MGHAAALVWRDWTHVGVANLFTRVDRNGYKILYLSSRSISHAGPTRGVRPKKYAAAWSCWRGTAAIVWRVLARRAGVWRALRSLSKSDMLVSYWAKFCWAA